MRGFGFLKNMAPSFLARTIFMIQYDDQRVGIFIDVQNMYYSARNLFDRKVNFGNVVTELTGDRRLIRAFAYVVTTKTGENQPFIDALSNIGIETREKELLEFLNGHKKADWDVGITVDAIRMADALDVIIIVSGDGDFIPLVEYLRSKGKIVEVGSFRKTTSTKLVEAVGIENYTDFSENKPVFLVPERGNRDSSSRTSNGGSRNQAKTATFGGVVPKKGGVVTDDPVAVSSKPTSTSSSRSTARRKTKTTSDSSSSSAKRTVTSRKTTSKRKTSARAVLKPTAKRRASTTKGATPTKRVSSTRGPAEKKAGVRARATNRKSATRKSTSDKKGDDSGGDYGLSANELALNN